MRKISYRIAVIAAFITSVAGLQAQTLTTDSTRKLLFRLNKVYDTTQNIAFDVRFLYDKVNDAQLGLVNHSEVNGSYIFNGKKAFYKLGDVEYLRNDSFAIAAYITDKIIVVSKPESKSASGYIPFNEMLDSITTSMVYAYTATAYAKTDTVNTVQFVKNHDSIPGYDTLRLSYNPVSYILIGMETCFREMPDVIENEDDLPPAANPASPSAGNSEPPPATVPVKLRIRFTDHRFHSTEPYTFSEARFIIEKNPNEWEPSDLYKGFTIYYTKPQN